MTEYLTLGNQETPIEGAAELIQQLHMLGKKVFFVTNNSTRSREFVFKHAQDLGFNGDGSSNIISIEQFYPTSYLTAVYCKKTLNSKKVFVIGLDGLSEEIQKQGIEAVPVPEEMLAKSRIGDKEFHDMRVDDTIDTVVCGYYPKITYHLL